MKNAIALLGQPNSGKSTVFNALTGSRQHVGNWPVFEFVLLGRLEPLWPKCRETVWK